MTGFTIIIPTYNAFEELALMLDSIAKNSILEHEILVYVDPINQSEPDSEIIRVLEDRGTHYIVNKNRLGPYGSWNLGAAVAKHEMLCFLTDDH